MLVTVDGKRISASCAQSKNALLPIFSKPSGRMSVFILQQPAKVFSAISLVPAKKVTDVNFSQPSNAFHLTVALEGMTILGIALLQKAPTPMTMATEMYYTGINPETGEKVFAARTMRDKEAQRKFFFWYKPEERKEIIGILRRRGRNDIIKKMGL